jgi:hypothetical protein
MPSTRQIRALRNPAGQPSKFLFMDERALSREALLRAAWREILATTPDNVRNFPAADRAIAAGAAVGDVVTAMRAASYETAFRLLYLVSSVHAPDDQNERDINFGWALIDFDLRHSPSGPRSALEGVHEDLLEADPSGRGSADLRD